MPAQWYENIEGTADQIYQLGLTSVPAARLSPDDKKVLKRYSIEVIPLKSDS